MRTRKLGDLEVAVVGMGTAYTFHNVPSQKDIGVRQQIIDNCIASDISFIDTSPMYGDSEKVLGVVTEGKRQQFQLATKVWTRGQGKGQEQIARSFRLLGTDYIEVFQIHNLVDWSTHLPALEDLKAEGKIGQIGITHYSPSRFPEIIDIMKTGRVDTIQIPYNVLERSSEKAVLPLAAELGMGVIVMEPLGVGRLVQGLKRQPDLSPLHDYGISTWAQALLAWIVADERVSVVIPATSRPERVGENARVGSLPPLPEELRDYISKEAGRCLS